MMGSVLMFTTLGVGAAGGLTAIVCALVDAQRRGPRAAGGWFARIKPRRLAVALGAGVVAGILTRWPVAAPLAGLGVLGLGSLSSEPGREGLAKLDGVATWTEMLRDTLAGSAGIGQAIAVTARNAPGPLQVPVRRLAGELTAGVPANQALVAFAIALGDPTGDVVAASLCLAVTHRAQRLGDLLGALATTAREEVAMRQSVEASRASARAAVRTIAGFTVLFVLAMSLLARPYVAPYATPTGQIVLGVVGAILGVGLWCMSAMTRPRRATRLFAEMRAG